MDSRVNNKVSLLPQRPSQLRLIAEAEQPRLLIEFIKHLIERKVLIEPISFSAIIRHARRLSGKTVPEIAEHMMVRPNSVDEWANGHWLPDPAERPAYIRTLASMLQEVERINATTNPRP